MKKYINRLIDNVIFESLREAGCVVVEGPKGCGKSTSCKKHANTVVELQKPATFREYKFYADTGDEALFQGSSPLMFDEWQNIPDLWDYIRAEVDDRGGKGHFIITGSAKPIEDKKRHSGIGRMKKLVMRTMSLFESGDSSGEISLKELFSGQTKKSANGKHNLSDIAFLLCRGGWPEAVVEEDSSLQLKFSKNYLNTLVSTDIASVDDVSRNPSRVKAVLKSYARNVSQAVRVGTILGDLELKDMISDPRTLDSYLNALKKLYVIEDVEAWSPSLRSKATLRSTETRQFVDPSIAAAALNASPQDLIHDLKTLGLLFENLCIRDLRIYSDAIDGTVFNYRDSTGLEADAIIHLNDGKWGAIEIKLGGEEAIEKAAQSLHKLVQKVNTDRMNEPSFLMVITATGFAYRRLDGVYVVPIGCLRD